jgi:hypothetical protein
MYRFCRYRRGKDGQIMSHIFELEEKSMLEEYLKTEEPGWYKHHKDVPLTEPVEVRYKLAHDLLTGEGLNHSSYTRAKLCKNPVNAKDKAGTKKEYDEALNHYKEQGAVKQGLDWFLNANDNS